MSDTNSKKSVCVVRIWGDPPYDMWVSRHLEVALISKHCPFCDEHGRTDDGTCLACKGTNLNPIYDSTIVVGPNAISGMVLRKLTAEFLNELRADYVGHNGIKLKKSDASTQELVQDFGALVLTHHPELSPQKPESKGNVNDPETAGSVP